MQVLWHESGWDDYIWWQSQDKKTLKRINALMCLCADIRACGNVQKTVPRASFAAPCGAGEDVLKCCWRKRNLLWRGYVRERNNNQTIDPCIACGLS